MRKIIIAALLTLTFIFIGCTAQRPSENKNIEPAKEKVSSELADAHAHLSEQAGFDAMLIAVMDQNGVEKSVLFGACEQDYLNKESYVDGIRPAHDQDVLKTARKYPDRFYPMLSGFDPQNENSPAYIENELKNGVWKGLGEIYMIHESMPAYKTRADNPVMEKIYPVLARYDVPIFFHYERWSPEDNEALLKVMKENPGTKFVRLHFAHSENDEELKKELSENPNLYVEFEEMFTEPISEETIELMEEFHDRFMIGTDTGCMDGTKTPQGHDYADAVNTQKTLLSKLKPETARQIGHDNLLKLLGEDTAPIKKNVEVTKSQLVEKNENLPPHCKDGVYNQGEQGLDCGWSCPNKCNFAEKCGSIDNDETWEGNILVTCNINVPEGVTLTIKPGTVIKMKHNRDYKNPDKTLFEVQGSLKAIGTPEKQIWFTSDAPDPINGDWSMLRLFGQTKSEIKYAIVEFAEQGINMWKSDAVISHSIIRWNNAEGLYAESYSTPVIEYNRVYQNGYNGMAMEQFNNIILRYNLFEKSGTHGLHIDVSKAVVENNILKENGAAGLSLDDTSTVAASGNTITGNKVTGIMCGEGDNKLTANNNKILNQETKIQCPETSIVKNSEGAGIERIDFDYPDNRNFEIDYTPGDRAKDRYQYVYPDDETRKIIKKIGKGLGLPWSITLEGNDIWVADLGGEISKMDQNGDILKQLRASSPQLWGMAFDGKNLWITDFAEKRTYSLDLETGKELFSFNNPDQERGAKGLAWDGEYLYIMGWTTNLVYKVDRAGNLKGTIELEGGAGGGLTFDGKYFWAPCSQICKYDKNGKLIGRIYVTSAGVWDLAWEPANNKAGGYLWATQRTNENWFDDEKIYKIEILDDSLK